MYVLRLLGGASLATDMARVTGPPVQRHRIALLALLATAPSASVSRDKLVALLWPEAGDQQARHSLNVAVHALRKALGVEAIRSVGANLQLDLDVVPCDVAAFLAAVNAGDMLAAVNTYTGPFLDGFHVEACEEFEHWQDSERARLAGQYRQALETLAVQAEAANDSRTAAEWWRQLGAVDPGDARIAARMMIALEKSGNRAGALAVAAAHTALLNEEYRAEPTPGLISLAERIRRNPVGLPFDGAELSPQTPLAAPPLPARELTAPEPTTQALGARTNRRPRRLLVGMAVAVTVVVGTAAYSIWKASSHEAARPPSASPITIAVLPFQNLSEDLQYQYLSDGITEELLNALARIPALHVAARTSSFMFRDRGVDVRHVGERLGVAALVEGSVRVAGNRLRITAQLIDTHTGYHLWSDEFDRTTSDLLATQEEIAHSVASALHVQLARRINDSLVLAGTASQEAHELYFRGRYEWNKRTEAGVLAARNAFERAAAIDPRYARAYAGLSDAWQLLPLYGHLPTSEGLANAKTAALRAIALDSTLAEAHTSLGVMLLEYDHDRAGAEREYRRAIELNPGYVTAHHWYALFLIAGGRVAEATHEAETARRVDPLSRIVNAAVGTVRLFARDYDAAIAEFRAIVNLEPEWATGLELLGRAHAAKGNHATAIPMIEQAVNLSRRRPSHVALLAYVYAQSGDTTKARGLLDELLHASDGSYAPPVDLAAVYVALHDPGEALRVLERGVQDRDEEMMYLKVDPRYDSLRRDARFGRILGDLDLR